jgi:hypothetical protein
MRKQGAFSHWSRLRLFSLPLNFTAANLSQHWTVNIRSTFLMFVDRMKAAD